MTRSRATTEPPKWLAPLLLGAALIVVAVLLGRWARLPGLPHGALGRMAPRIASPRPDLRGLLFLLGVGSVTWYAVTIAFPFLLWGARRLEPARLGRLRSVAIAVGSVAALVALTAIVRYLVLYAGLAARPELLDTLPDGLREAVPAWLAAAGVIGMIEARRRADLARLERESLRAQVAEQRLIALVGQLQPHFLFNTLQSISTLIHRHPDAADEMLGKLSDLLRELLRHRDSALVPLEDELRFARTYLEIAHVRFGERLTFAIDALDELRHAAVPLFILQPLVENAVAHGIGPRAAGGRIEVLARRSADRLVLEIADDGVGLDHAAMNGRGIGLRNVRERLHATFGEDQTFVLESGPGRGAIARIEMPFRAWTAGGR